MRIPIITVSCVLFALPIFNFAIASGPTSDDRTASDAPRPDYCRLGDVVGAKVRMLPSKPALDEATKKNEVVERPKGKIDDLLIDTCDGTATWAVVTFDTTLGLGGKTVVIPCARLNWNAEESSFDLDQSDEQLKLLPAFDASEAKENGIDRTLAALAKTWPDVKIGHEHEESRSASGDDPKKRCPTFLVGEHPCACAQPQMVFASDISSSAVHCADSKFGAFSSVLLDRKEHRIAYVVVTHDATLGVGGTDYLIPYAPICLHENEKGRAYCLAFTTSELESGVKYEEPEHGCLDVEQARRADAFFSARKSS